MPLPTLRPSLRWLAAALISFAIVFLLYRWYAPAPGTRWGTYDWHCTSCGYNFRAPIPADASQQFVIDCPRCGKPTAERIVHLTCRDCGAHFDLQGPAINNRSPHCPKCQSPNIISDR